MALGQGIAAISFGETTYVLRLSNPVVGLISFAIQLLLKQLFGFDPFSFLFSPPQRINLEKGQIENYFDPIFNRLHSIGYPQVGNHYDIFSDAQRDLQNDPILWDMTQRILSSGDSECLAKKVFPEKWDADGFQKRMVYQYFDNAWGDGWTYEMMQIAWDATLCSVGCVPKAFPLPPKPPPNAFDATVPYNQITASGLKWVQSSRTWLQVPLRPQFVYYGQTDTAYYMGHPVSKLYYTPLETYGPALNTGYATTPYDIELANGLSWHGPSQQWIPVDFHPQAIFHGPSQQMYYLNRAVTPSQYAWLMKYGPIPPNVLEVPSLDSPPPPAPGPHPNPPTPSPQPPAPTPTPQPPTPEPPGPCTLAEACQQLVDVRTALNQCCNQSALDDQVQYEMIRSLSARLQECCARIDQQAGVHAQQHQEMWRAIQQAQQCCDTLRSQTQDSLRNLQDQISRQGQRLNQLEQGLADEEARRQQADQRLRDEAERAGRYLDDKIGGQQVQLTTITNNIINLQVYLNVSLNNLFTTITNNYKTYVTEGDKVICNYIDKKVKREVECIETEVCDVAREIVGKALECWFDANTAEPRPTGLAFDSWDGIRPAAQAFGRVLTEQSTGEYQEACRVASANYRRILGGERPSGEMTGWRPSPPVTYVYDDPTGPGVEQMRLRARTVKLLPGEVDPCLSNVKEIP